MRTELDGILSISLRSSPCSSGVCFSARGKILGTAEGGRASFPFISSGDAAKQYSVSHLLSLSIQILLSPDIFRNLLSCFPRCHWRRSSIEVSKDTFLSHLPLRADVSISVLCVWGSSFTVIRIVGEVFFSQIATPVDSPQPPRPSAPRCADMLQSGGDWSVVEAFFWGIVHRWPFPEPGMKITIPVLHEVCPSSSPSSSSSSSSFRPADSAA